MTLGKTLLTDHDSGISFNWDTDVRMTILYVEINWDFSYLFVWATTRNKGYSMLALCEFQKYFQH